MQQTQTWLPRCSVIIVGYNSAPDLPACFDALLGQEYPDFEIILVDNASQDDTAQIANTYAESIRYLKLNQNVGFAAGNNRGAGLAQGDILVFLNPDTVPRASWLKELVMPLIEDASIGLTTSRILMAEEPHRINACGNDITWTGLTVCRGIDQLANQWSDSSEVAAVSGAAFAVKQALFKELGGFDEEFFMYFEDTDLSLRTRLSGYRIVYIPDSVVTHRYIFKFSAQKAYYQERNRWLALFKTLRVRTLLLLLPCLLLGEVMAWTYAAMSGLDHVKAKASSWLWLLRHSPMIMRQRRQIRARRRVTDRELLRHWSPNLRFKGTVPAELAQMLEGVTTLFLRSYGALFRRLAAW